MLLLVARAFAKSPQSGGGEHPAEAIPWETIAYSGANLLLFVGLMVWFAWRPVGDSLKARALKVRQSIDESARVRDEAHARFSDIEGRLISLDRRIDEMQTRSDADADAEAVRIAERAQVDAARIRGTTERTIREEADRARDQIRGEAVALAVALARETLKKTLTAEDQERLAREILAAVDKEDRHA